MSTLYADTAYWIAMLQSNDRLHGRAVRASHALRGEPVVTTELVCVEVLNYFSASGASLRRAACAFVEALPATLGVTVIPLNHELYAEAFGLYGARLDKSWSLTDCASILVCQRAGILDVLTFDHHFAQAGLRCLLRQDEAY